MDEFQKRFAKMIWQREPELLEDLPRLKALLADYIQHPAYRRALLTAVECKVAQSIKECTTDRLPILQSQCVKKLENQGIRREDAAWTVDTLADTVSALINPCEPFGLGLEYHRRALDLFSSFEETIRYQQAAECCLSWYRSAITAHFATIQRGAENGDVLAQWELVQLLERGNAPASNKLYEGGGVIHSVNGHTVHQWCRSAAEGGNADAQFRLGEMYRIGYGIDGSVLKGNLQEAQAWFQRAADQGHPYAQSMLDSIANGRIDDDIDGVYGYEPNDDDDDPDDDDDDDEICDKYCAWGLKCESGEGVEQDCERAVAFYRVAAERGYARGQRYLANMYNWGSGVREDYAEAARWYRKAAEQGDLEALCNIGYMYYEGEGVAQDYWIAFKCYRKAAKEGHPTAQYDLGNMYYFGRAVDQDYTEAVKWYRKAAEQGDAAGQLNLGIMYQSGTGIEQNFAEAVEWYRKAAEQGHADGQNNLGVMYEYGKGVEQDYAEAVEWYRKAAEQGHADGQFNLGDMYEWGKGLEQDYAEAVRWYRKAAEQGDTDGQCNLGDMYEYGKGVEQDYAEAVEWYRKAAEQGDTGGQCNLGRMYEWGKGLERSKAEAFTWFQKAAAQSSDTKALIASAYDIDMDSVRHEVYLMRAADLGDDEAQVELGYLYESWDGDPRFHEAVHYYSLAADQGSEDAYRALAKLHFHGFGVQENGELALRYLKLAGEPKTDADRRYGYRCQTLAKAQSGDGPSMYTIGLWYLIGEEQYTDGWYEYEIEKDTTRARSWIGRSAEAGFAIAVERLRQMDSPQNLDGRYVDAKYGKLLFEAGDIIGGGSVLWFEKMQGDFESQDLLTALEDSLVGDKHKPYELISGIIQRLHEISIVQAAADDEWEYKAGEYLIAYTEYLNSEGAMAAAESVFRSLMSSYWDRFFLVQQPDQTWVVVHRPPRSAVKEVSGVDTIRQMCGRLRDENAGWDENEGDWSCDEDAFVDVLDDISKTFIQAGGDLRVTWEAWVTAEDAQSAVEMALKDLSNHREDHEFETQYRGFRESIPIQASKFTLD